MTKTMLYFGSFNPVHIGHTAIANYALAEGLADEFWFVVSPQNPFKTCDQLADQEHRLSILNMALENSGIAGVTKACDIEFSMPKPSFTIDTLERLKIENASKEFSLIMGEDNFADIKKWKNYEKIVDSHKIFIYPRAGSIITEDLIAMPNTAWLNDAPLFDISATKLREYLSSGKYIPALMPTGVYQYIIDNKLYANYDTNR